MNNFASWRIIFCPTCAGVVWGLVWSAHLAVVEADEGVRVDVPHSEQSLASTCRYCIINDTDYCLAQLFYYFIIRILFPPQNRHLMTQLNLKIPRRVKITEELMRVCCVVLGPVHLCHLTCLHFLCVQGKSSLSEVKSMWARLCRVLFAFLIQCPALMGGGKTAAGVWQCK